MRVKRKKVANMFFFSVICTWHNINCVTQSLIMLTLSPMYVVTIKSGPAGSAVPVARLSDMEQAISFGFQLHQISSCKHFIVVEEDGSQLATFVRSDSITLPAPSKNQVSQESSKGLKNPFKK